MKARIRTDRFELGYDGAPAIWNEFLRPILGGPKALPDPEDDDEDEDDAPAPQVHVRPLQVQTPLRPARPDPLHREPIRAQRPVTAPAPRRDTWTPAPDGQRPERDDRPARRPRPKAQAPRIEKSSDPANLYARLGEIPGRRSEKDSVLAAVWFLSKDDGDTTPEAVERHLREHGGPVEVKVRPHLQKHVNRSKMLDQGEQPGTFRINRKGARYVVENLVGD